ncbi:MAG: hypothetical protein E4H13_10585 [Calditrichales bacterium]|nr:MAG: hypothetical protein E4H13_10585 [Calditrichales bacterium]
MITNHLSDEDLQAYLDAQTASEKDSIEIHLSKCAECRSQLQAYRQLYGILETDTAMGLSPDFATRVISTIAAKPEHQVQKQENALIMAFFMIASAVGIYFLNPLSLAMNASDKIFKTGGEVVAHWIGILNGNLPFLIAVVLIFFLVQLIDLRLTKPR